MRILRYIPVLFLLFFEIVIADLPNDLNEVVKNCSFVLLDSTIIEKRDVLISCWNNEILLLPNKCSRIESSWVYHLLLPEKHLKFPILIPDSIWDYRNHISDFAANNNYIYLLNRNKVITLRFVNDTLILDKIIKLNSPCFNIKICNNKIICYNSNIIFNQDSISNTYEIIYDLNKGNQFTKYFKNPKGLKWTYIQPRQLMDVNSKMTLLSDATNYFIRIYNDSLKITDTLARTPKKWISENNLHKDSISGKKNLMDDLSKISLIQRAEFLSENRIIVFWTTPPDNDNSNYNTIYDIWEKNNGKWELINNDLESIIPNNESIFTSSLFKINSIEILINNNKIITIQAIPFEINKDFFKKTNKEVTALINDYFFDHKPRYSIIIRELK